MNRSVLGALLVGLLFAGRSFAQSPEDEWQQPGGTPAPVPVVPEPLPVPPPTPLPAAPPAYYPQTPPPPSALLKARPEVVARIRAPEAPNRVSMLGAPALGAGQRGQLVVLGFPLLSLRALFGLTERFDLGVGFDSYYFLMNEPRLVARYGLARGESWSFSATLEGGYAFFAQRASREARGSRWLTGRRNINVSPAVVVSYQGSAPRAARFFLELRYLLALDTEPYATDPLVGVPPAVVPGHNVGLKGGAELPLSTKTSFVLGFEFMVHGRAEDAVVMPGISLGLVTGL